MKNNLFVIIYIFLVSSGLRSQNLEVIRPKIDSILTLKNATVGIAITGVGNGIP